MADLKISKAKTLKWEGGYCNVVGDAGGETIFGIARNMHPKLKLWQIVDNYKSGFKPKFSKGNYSHLETLCLGNEEFKDEMYSFYRKNFWEKIKGDQIKSQEVANILYDFAVNSGVSRAVKVLQEAINKTGYGDHEPLKVDGVLGDKTLKEVNRLDSKSLCNVLCDRRKMFFESIAKKGDNAKFLKGWLNRVQDFYA